MPETRARLAALFARLFSFGNDGGKKEPDETTPFPQSPEEWTARFGSLPMYSFSVDPIEPTEHAEPIESAEAGGAEPPGLCPNEERATLPSPGELPRVMPEVKNVGSSSVLPNVLPKQEKPEASEAPRASSPRTLPDKAVAPRVLPLRTAPRIVSPSFPLAAETPRIDSPVGRPVESRAPSVATAAEVSKTDPVPFAPLGAVVVSQPEIAPAVPHGSVTAPFAPLRSVAAPGGLMPGRAAYTTPETIVKFRPAVAAEQEEELWPRLSSWDVSAARLMGRAAKTETPGSNPERMLF